MKKRASEQGFTEIELKGKLRELASRNHKQAGPAIGPAVIKLSTDLQVLTLNKYSLLTKNGQ